MSIWEQLKSLFAGGDPASVTFKPEWADILEKNLPLYSRFPDELKREVHEKISQFVATTFFEGCGGLELTNEMILTVAGQACTLIVKHEGPPYPNLKSVLLYPSSFTSTEETIDELGTVTREKVTRLGESWSNGTVILAWDSVASGARNVFDGRNVAFHEFAHQLDQENDLSDGIPFLSSQQAYHTWAEILNDGFDELIEKAEKGKRAVMDHYGATDRAEFFAVATECFFEKPRQMSQKHPQLYEVLRDYYQLNPLEWYEKSDRA